VRACQWRSSSHGKIRVSDMNAQRRFQFVGGEIRVGARMVLTMQSFSRLPQRTWDAHGLLHSWRASGSGQQQPSQRTLTVIQIYTSANLVAKHHACAAGHPGYA
jgi:hypothetical protein